MSIEIVLLILRVISGVSLLAILLAIFVFVRREFHARASQTQLNRRSFGHLVALVKTDDTLIPNGKIYPILPLTSIGRSPTNTITIDDSYISSEHAVVALRNSRWWLDDRNSRNGTLLNDQKVTKSIIITNGDIIGIGKYNFRIEME